VVSPLHWYLDTAFVRPPEEIVERTNAFVLHADFSRPCLTEVTVEGAAEETGIMAQRSSVDGEPLLGRSD